MLMHATSGVPHARGNNVGQELLSPTSFGPGTTNGSSTQATMPNGQALGHQNDGPRKKRRSRKGLDKRFECTVEGCGKSYSRAEHLQRHQLNHNSAQTFRCQYPDCTRTFVRLDLLKRHLDRHTAKGSAQQDSPQEKGNDAALTSPTYDSSNGNPNVSLEGESIYNYGSSNNTPTSDMRQQQQQQQDLSHYERNGSVGSHSGYTPTMQDQKTFQQNMQNSRQISNDITPSSASFSLHPANRKSHSFQTHNSQYNMYEQPQQQQPNTRYALDPSQNPVATVPFTTSNHFSVAANVVTGPDPTPSQPSDLIMLDQLAMPGSGPVFGSDSGLQKSPVVGMPEDFMAYLFHAAPAGVSALNQNLAPLGLNYGDLQDSYYGQHNFDTGVNFNQVPSGPYNVMAVNNLVDADIPEASISEDRSQEIYDFIKDRFHGHEHVSLKQMREGIVGGDRQNDDHMLSRKMMQAYIWSYWYSFSDQMPIIHKASFSAEGTPTLLLLAMMAIGSACLDKTHGTEVTVAGARVSNFLATHLRWELFMDPNFRPPAKLWVFQTLLVLELFEKMCSTRELHERAHIHHATTITLMRRGRSLIGKSSLDSPLTAHDGGPASRQSSTSGAATSQDERWHNWILSESTKRAACAAFVIDSIHSSMFGHSGVMVAHEMRLPLPCDDSLWRATSGSEVARAESALLARGIRPISFLEGLKCTLNGQEVNTTSFGRTVLMAGLLSVTHHMHQRDLQVNVLGGGVVQALGGRDKWRATLTRAYDFWKANFDKAVEESNALPDPYRNGSPKTESNVIFESRTVLHDLAHMAMHADIVDCQMFARAHRLLGRPVGPQEFNAAQRRIKEFWAPSARARDATFYALQFLRSVMAPDLATGTDHASPIQEQPYDTRHDVLLNRPWVLYFAALVVWCYGFAVEGPCMGLALPTSQQEQWMQMRAYLATYAAAPDPNELLNIRGFNQNTALLMVIKESFENSRWELLHEAAALLQNCVMLNSGANVT